MESFTVARFCHKSLAQYGKSSEWKGNVLRAASVRIKLKVLATQRHFCKRAVRSRWLAISRVRFLYGLPTYIYSYI